MEELNSLESGAEKAAQIILDAGGELVGKTRLQKVAYILEITGLGFGFSFEYRHYGPFSEDLANGLVDAEVRRLISHEERPATWGGTYSIFRATGSSSKSAVLPSRDRVLQATVKANPVALELAATAAFLAIEGNPSPWAETQRRKPEKADKFLDSAKDLYRQLRLVDTPKALPEIFR
jgi:uncharacterized protein YwgA